MRVRLTVIWPLLVGAALLVGAGRPALASPGTAQAWGYNNSGQLGNGSNTDSNVPVPVSGLTDAVAAAGGVNHSVALKSDGTVRAWGQNYYGQLGTGNNTNSNVPVVVSGLASIVAVASGSEHNLALKSDGTVWTWGRNDYGQLGNGANTHKNVPVQVSGLTGVVAVGGGWYHSLALKSDGTVRAWGWNVNGALGNGANTDSNIPVVVSGLTGAVAVAGGGYHSLALKSDGTVRAWGLNDFGQLGTGDYFARNTPAVVSSLTGVRALAGGGNHSLAVKSDGTVRAWGQNCFHGQLGDGTLINRNTPIQVSGLTGMVAVAAGSAHSVALQNDGTVHSWGRNNSGQLGNGSNTDSYLPVPVSGLADVGAVGGSSVHCLALIGRLPTVSITTPANGSYTSSLGPITGTAAPSPRGTATIATVEVRIKRVSNGAYWTGSGFSTTETWLLANGTNTWSYTNTPGGGGVAGGVFEICARATDTLGVVSHVVCITVTLDVTAPTVKYLNPTYNSCRMELTGISGTATDNTGGSSVASLVLRLRRDPNDGSPLAGKYWNGSTWQTGGFTLALSGLASWSVTTPMPTGSSLPDGRYILFAYVYDAVGNWRYVGCPFLVDATLPEVFTFTAPADGAHVTDLATITGTASDSGSGLKLVLVRIRQFNGPGTADDKWWSPGVGWVSGTAPTLATTNAASWSVTVALPQASDMTPGQYKVYGYAYDWCGNRRDIAVTVTKDP